MLQTRALQVALAVNTTNATIAASVPQIATPTGAGVFDLTNGGTNSLIPRKLLVMPYGVGSDGNTFLMKVMGWRHIGQLGPQSVPLWVPVPLIGLSGVISSALPGIASSPLGSTQYFAKTLTITSAGVSEPVITNVIGGSNLMGTAQRFSPADASAPAWALIETYGVEMIQFLFGLNSSSTSLNALFALLDHP